MHDIAMNPHLSLTTSEGWPTIPCEISNLFSQKELGEIGDTISMVLGNLGRAAAVERWKGTHGADLDHQERLFYSRRDSFYYLTRPGGGQDRSARARYRLNHWTRKKICAVIDRLVDAGLVEHRLGYWVGDDDQSNRASTVRASDELVELIAGPAKSGIWSGSFDVRWASDGEAIILRDEEKRFQGYRETRNTRRMRKNLALINEVNQDHEFSTDLNKQHQEKPGGQPGAEPFIRGCFRLGCQCEWLDTLSLRPIRIAASQVQARLDTSMVRIFNNSSFGEGGRFYRSEIQGLPKAIRSEVRIDGEPSVELDYSGLHIRLLYALAGQQYQDDPYLIEGMEHLRDVAKTLCLICINTTGRREAIPAFTRHLREDGVTLPEGVSAERMIQAFESKHEPIRDRFFSGTGLRAQNVDSRIAEGVMLDFAREDRPIACVHDSFVVRCSDEEILRRSMTQNYRAVTGGFTPVIK